MCETYLINIWKSRQVFIVAMSLDDTISSTLQNVYRKHGQEHTGRTCNLERNLPLKEPYFIIKRVPRFRVRADLHTDLNPAYIPLSRLEAASVDDLISPKPNGCRKILLEGDIGVGKTTLCYNILHRWEKFLNEKTDEAISIIIYIDCATLEPLESDTCIVTHTLIGYLAQEGVNLPYKAVSDWLEANGNDVEVMFDNVTRSPAIMDRIVNIMNRPNMLFSRVTVVTSTGLMTKDLFDTLYYCYGMNPDYSNKVLFRQLKKASDKPEEKMASLHKLDCQQEFNRNPLSLSAVISYLNSVDNGVTPRHKYDLLRGIVRMAVPETLQRRAETNIKVDIQHCTDILAEKAFHSMSDRDHNLHRESFPQWFRGQHLCDFCFVHDIHGPLTATTTTKFSFTSRCFRDFFAVQHAVTLLKIPSQTESVLKRLMEEKSFLPLLSLCCRQLKLCGHEDLLRRMFLSMIKEVQKRFVSIQSSDHTITKGLLRHFGRILNCLHELEFQKEHCELTAKSFPHILEFSFQDCSKRTIEDLSDLIAHTEDKMNFVTSGIVLHLDGMASGVSEAVRLAGALNEMTSLTTLMISAVNIAETSFFVGFLCDIFQDNSHIVNLTVRGPMNSVHNLTAENHRRVRSVFHKGNSLRSLTIENFQHQHKAAYVIRCWPAIFDKLEIQKCNLEASAPDLVNKISQSSTLSLLCLDFCYIPPSKLIAVLQALASCPTLRSLQLNTLSAKRKFNSTDLNTQHFRFSMTQEVCEVLKSLIENSKTLTDLSLCQNGLEEKAAVVLDAAAACSSLQSLDLTGNKITDNLRENVTMVIMTRHVRRLILGSNSFTAEGRKAIIKASIERDDLQLSV